MRLKKFFCLICCLALTFSLCSCGGGVEGKKKIAVIVKSVDSDFWHSVKSGVNSAATELNVYVTFEGPDNEEDYITQNEMINKAVEDGANAIVLSAINYYKSAQAVEEAVKKGVKIITIDSDVNSSAVSMFIGTDNVEAGRAAGRAAADGFADNQKIYIGVVNCDENTGNGIQREQGLREYVSTLKNAEVVASVNVSSNTYSATSGALSLIQQYPQINVLVGINEWMTLGVGNAIKQLSAAERIRGIGFDTNVVSVGMIETGEMDALIVQNSFAIGYLGVKNAAEIIVGSTADKKMLYTDVTTVNKSNLFDEDVQKILFRFE